MNLAVALEPARYAAPKNCQECSGLCIEVCPSVAVFRTVESAVMIAPMKCSGCQLCIVACPLGIIYFDPGNKIARMMEIEFA